MNAKYHEISFLDGILTEVEQQQITHDVRDKRDFLTPPRYQEIFERDETLCKNKLYRTRAKTNDKERICSMSNFPRFLKLIFTKISPLNL